MRRVHSNDSSPHDAQTRRSRTESFEWDRHCRQLLQPRGPDSAYVLWDFPVVASFREAPFNRRFESRQAWPMCATSNYALAMDADDDSSSDLRETWLQR